jgi:hypothetical protein
MLSAGTAGLVVAMVDCSNSNGMAYPAYGVACDPDGCCGDCSGYDATAMDSSTANDAANDGSGLPDEGGVDAHDAAGMDVADGQPSEAEGAADAGIGDSSADGGE